MAYSTLTNEADLIAYIKRDLGDTSHTIELSDPQVLDCVNDAIKLFLEKAYDGSDEFYEQLDYTSGTQLYTLDDDIIAVMSVKDTNLNSSNKVAMQEFYAYNFEHIYSISSDVILNYALTQSYLSSMESIVAKDTIFSFNATTHELRIHTTINTDHTVLLHTIRSAGASGESTFNMIYNHRFIKKQATANAWMKWAKSLIKYDGELWDGNNKIDKEAIMQVAERELEEAKEMLMNEYVDSYSIIYR